MIIHIFRFNNFYSFKIHFTDYMKKYLLNILFFSLIFAKISFSQTITTPAVEWSEYFLGGSRGGYIGGSVAGPNVLFVVLNSLASNGPYKRIIKFDANGMINKPISFDPYLVVNQYACQDGGILVNGLKYIRKYDANMNLVWDRNVPYMINNATATLANGFYIYTTSFISNKTIIEIKRLKDDGSEEWSSDITAFTSNVTDIQTTSDDGVIVGTNNGLRKYSAKGQLLWNNLSIVNATKFVPLDADRMYIQVQNSSLNNILGILQINTQNGTNIWTKNFASESIVDFEITIDKGCAVMTNSGLYKFNSSGLQEWKNTQYTSSNITTTGDGGIIIVGKANDSGLYGPIIKLSINNVFNWSKDLFGYNLDVYGASDNGLYVVKGDGGYNSFPQFNIFKIASPDTPCKMNFDLTVNSATFCSSGNLPLAYSFSKTKGTASSIPSSDISHQWNRNNSAIAFATSRSYIADSPGKYNLTLTQGTCESTSRTIEMKIVTAPVIQADKSTICQGQTVNLSSTGCEGTVVWSNGTRGSNLKITPQLTTSYNAYCESTITNASGMSEVCKTNLSNTIVISVIPFSNLKIEEIKGKKEFCEAGSTTLEVVTSGGIQPFNYTWNKNNVAAVVSPNGILKINEEGNYQLLLTDGKGCSVSSETFPVKKVSNPVNPNIVAQGLTEFCLGSSVILTTDTKEANYQWLKNETPIKEGIDQFYKAESSGIYRVQVINSTGCLTTSAQSITINVVVVPQPFIKQSNDTLISSYLNENKWFFNDSQLNENGNKIKFTTNTGNYQVKAVFKGCESELSSVFMPIVLANENSIADVSLYPNPVSKNLVISSSQLIKYKFYNILGRVLKEESDYKTRFDIDVSSLNDGEYLLLFQGINQNKYFRKIVIRK